MAFFPRHHYHQQKQQQQQPPAQAPQRQQPPIPFTHFVPIDGQSAAPMPFSSPFPDPNPASFVNVMGIAPGSATAAEGVPTGWEPRRKRPKEQDLLENSQISSIDFLQTGSVSTGLGLSLDDRRAAAAVGAAASTGESPPLHLLPMIDEDIDKELQRMDAEVDRFIKIEGERLRKSILEKVHAKQFQTLASLEEKILRKIREKDSEVEDINTKNLELEEHMKQLAAEASAWQQRAKYNENMINSLKYSLEQLYAQNLRDHKEGCGDNEVDDTASCCNGEVNLQLMGKQSKNPKESMICKVCKANEVCMLLLPCRHLCLCKDCESKLSFCPLCQASKYVGMEIYI